MSFRRFDVHHSDHRTWLPHGTSDQRGTLIRHIRTLCPHKPKRSSCVSNVTEFKPELQMKRPHAPQDKRVLASETGRAATRTPTAPAAVRETEPRSRAWSWLPAAPRGPGTVRGP